MIIIIIMAPYLGNGESYEPPFHDFMTLCSGVGIGNLLGGQERITVIATNIRSNQSFCC